MTLHRAAFVAVAVAALTLAGPGLDRASAQALSPWSDPATVWSGPATSLTSFGTGSFGLAAMPDPVPRFPYSYYAAFPSPARQYVPYGALDAFPYHGAPYGKPYDRWTWAYLAGPPSSLQRYYYPPVR